jgi:hypothetical protein
VRGPANDRANGVRAGSADSPMGDAAEDRARAGQAAQALVRRGRRR